MAAVAVTFARYFLDLTHLPITDWVVAAIALGVLTLINCLGVRAGSSVQSALMVLKILAIVALIASVWVDLDRRVCGRRSLATQAALPG